jgi:magnesium transporter
MVEIAINFEVLIRERNWKKLRSELEEMDPVDIAEVIEMLSDDDDVILFRLLPRKQAKHTFQQLSHNKQEQIVEQLAKNTGRVASLLNDLDPDDRTAFLEELPGSVSQKLILLLSPDERKVAQTLLGYPENSIGRLMTPDYVAVKSNYTIEQTLRHVREFGHDSETLNVIYIIDEDWRLIDDVRIREILLARPDQKISELLDNRFIALNAFDDQEKAISIFQDHDRVALPVTDTDGHLIGIITFDDVMDVVEEEHTEDFHKFGAFKDTVVNPLKAGITYVYKKRIFWLFTLVFMNVFSGAALAHYENVIQSVVSLIFFLPLLIGSGGNAGAQSATLMIRSLATGDVELSDWLRLVGREILVSFLLGISMAVAVSLVATVRSPEIIIVVSVTMIATVMVGSLIGLSLPFIFTRLRLDPATASAPLITSIADITGVIIYFSIATWYFSGAT